MKTRHSMKGLFPNRNKYPKGYLTQGEKKQVSRIASRQVLRNQEKLFFDNIVSNTVNNTGLLYGLTNVAQGASTDTTRRGDKCRALQIKWRVTMEIVPAAVADVVRLIIFQWHLDDQVTGPTPALILQSATSVHSMYNHDNGGKFSVIYDKFIHLSIYNTGSAMFQGKINFDSKDKRLKYIRRNMKFNAGAAGGQDMIYALFISDSLGNSPTNIGYFRFLFTDS